MPIAFRTGCSPAVALLAAVLSVAASAAQGEGLTADADGLGWSRWQSRVSLVTAAPAWRADLASLGSRNAAFGSVRLLGDYYFVQQNDGASATGGFRATSGLIVGSRATPWAPVGVAGGGFSIERRALPATTSADATPVPYMGLGWSGTSLRSGWSFSADLGVMSLNPGGAVKFGRVLGSLQNVDEVLRDLRLSPMLQVGASYAF